MRAGPLPVVILRLVVALPLLAAASALAAPDVAGDGRVLVVAVAESPPFAIKEADGTWSGLSVELWSDVADRLGLRWEPREVELARVPAALRDGTVSAALGAIAIGADGAAVHDYSAPYYATGVGFAQRSDGGLSWAAAAQLLASSQILKVSAMMLMAIVLVGVLIALIERHYDAEDFGGPLRKGLANGVWWAAVTMTTVGYGDATPKTTPGRSLALLWMFIGVVALAIFTATVTSVLTVGSLHGAVRRPADLLHLRLGAVDGGAGTEFLSDRHVSFIRYDSYDDALRGLTDRAVDAVVANVPALRYEATRRWQGAIEVSPIVLEPVSYAFGLPNRSPLREEINRTLLGIIEQDRWRDVERQYLGAVRAP